MSTIRGGLNPVELGVLSAFRHQRFVSADLSDARAVEHDDLIGHPHRAEPMRDQNSDLSLPSVARATVAPFISCGSRVALEERVFGLRVERRCRFVEHEQERMIALEAARERELLPLSKTHFDSTWPGRAE